VRKGSRDAGSNPATSILRPFPDRAKNDLRSLWRRRADFPTASNRATNGCAMFYVYLLRSERNPAKTYVGFTANMKTRLVAHNTGQSRHSAKFRPWRLDGYFAFSSEQRAREFEVYLKTASGIAFARKRLWSTRQLARRSSRDLTAKNDELGDPARIGTQSPS
jgi:putative endonuclease